MGYIITYCYYILYIYNHLHEQCAVVLGFQFPSAPHSNLEGPRISNPCFHLTVQGVPSFTRKVLLQGGNISPLLGHGKAPVLQVIAEKKVKKAVSTPCFPIRWLFGKSFSLHRRKRSGNQMVNTLDSPPRCLSECLSPPRFISGYELGGNLTRKWHAIWGWGE